MVVRAGGDLDLLVGGSLWRCVERWKAALGSFVMCWACRSMCVAPPPQLLGEVFPNISKPFLFAPGVSKASQALFLDQSRRNLYYWIRRKRKHYFWIWTTRLLKSGSEKKESLWLVPNKKEALRLDPNKRNNGSEQKESLLVDPSKRILYYWLRTQGIFTIGSE